ncbi:PREDICTED: uncharacterized protein LOC106114714 [Papilio xuthus]|uniref:Uncharacterized protein LOC106114714 n=1 Tax=Papilio xuthus TaxID=66420 RepID=A0AAJ7E5I3_PAPXU|nr:PREDICTED: uncharacterized protein LOC106114714 [Papilio xuthus]
MGTRSSAKIKLRSLAFKCNICGRRLMSAEALKTHQLCIHNITNRIRTKVTPKQGITKPKTQPTTQKMKNLKLEKSKNAPTKIVVNTKPEDKIEEKVPKRGTKSIETTNEYECPKCFKNYPDYFLAHRHIQKYHCVNNNNEKVSANSPDLIKPNIMLVCSRCNRRPKSLDTHKCTSFKYDQIENAASYLCMACNEEFQSLRLFDLHVSGLHCDGVESMFFPTNEVFQTWKEDVVKQTGINYYVLGNYSYKQMFRCPCIPDDNVNSDIIPYLCPSSIVVQELSKGIQVHYYMKHYSHACGIYVLPDEFKKYMFSTLLQNEEAYTEIDIKANGTEIYQQFKQLMDCIVQDAANVKIDSLKILLTKALDMTTVLSNEVETDSAFMSMKLIIDNNIIGLLNSNQHVKRKNVLNEKKNEPITKRFKTRTYQNKDCKESLDDASIKIVNSFSLAEHEIVNAINEDNETIGAPENNTTDSQSSSDKEKDDIKVNKKLDQSSSSFADSYKVFVKQLSEPGPPLRKRKFSTTKNKCESLTKEANVEEEINVTSDMKQKDVPIIPKDYKYEIKEQENDCNILILKI